MSQHQEEGIPAQDQEATLALVHHQEEDLVPSPEALAHLEEAVEVLEAVEDLVQFMVRGVHLLLGDRQCERQRALLRQRVLDGCVQVKIACLMQMNLGSM